MKITEALKITGFQICEWKADGTDSDTCNDCVKTIPKGENIYYERTCHDVDEGNYYCAECVIKKPQEWQSISDDLEKEYGNK